MVLGVTIPDHIALRKAKIVCSFGLSECNRVKHIRVLKIMSIQVKKKTDLSAKHKLICSDSKKMLGLTFSYRSPKPTILLPFACI